MAPKPRWKSLWSQEEGQLRERIGLCGQRIGQAGCNDWLLLVREVPSDGLCWVK